MGSLAAGVLDWLAAVGGLAGGHAHLLGQSLGAHTAAMAARDATFGRVARLSGEVFKEVEVVRVQLFSYINSYYCSWLVRLSI